MDSGAPPKKKVKKRPKPTPEEALALGTELLALLGTLGVNSGGGTSSDGGGMGCNSGSEGCTKAALREVLKRGAAASFQRDSDGVSALMLAAGAGAGELVSTLLMYGAPWNAVDRHGLCAGQYALRAGHQDVVDQLVNAGVMAEMVLGAVMGKRPERKRQLEQLHLGDEETVGTAAAGDDVETGAEAGGAATADGASELQGEGGGAYLDRSVRYEGDSLLDTEDDAVMMEWERPLMEAHCELLCGPPGAGGGDGAAADGAMVDVLNVGFGMGIFDGMVQRRAAAAGGRVRTHTICEAHPAVYAKMLADGWADKPGVRIVFGRWQDQLPVLTGGPDGSGCFDAIFFDTYGEHHSDMQEFHAALPSMLRRSNPAATYSFFNGMCPDNVFFQGVACQVVQLELAKLGLTTEFRRLPLARLEGKVWEGVKRRYWHDREEYFMPVSRWAEVKAEAGAEVKVGGGGGGAAAAECT